MLISLGYFIFLKLHSSIANSDIARRVSFDIRNYQLKICHFILQEVYRLQTLHVDKVEIAGRKW